MTNKICEFILLIFYWALCGIAIGVVIVNGLKDGLDIALLVCIFIQVLLRTFISAITLLNKENKK